MKVKLIKKNLKNLNKSNELNHNATPQVGGGAEPSIYPVCRPTNPVICWTGRRGCVTR
ncbi:hypothetical protein [Pseudoalteromonas luteoviolacea]|uniref:Uncharacterized protein n=1 Tax=Pseudoalteromonas luteoviolacea H33 TaxID=1365251 RepID=A0A167FUC8_9GAMM|nr:hypothetical protein [Pseudoalteromonas luteoviolacea]KZN52999.1 hypothetical protein N476_09445 [Pseudoalteromonas luteoviolacea H33]KZN78084.1 hypothetical protein N477_10620 [Pseudoalteromonas luteoviolacea H33-S]MBQ4875714.1 hypothetical protein [Pseudoalteromonas luteoviolacea]MBQ4904749.1 hypothetical protein [Pseudoalteromonas luteoviolacea]